MWEGLEAERVDTECIGCTERQRWAHYQPESVVNREWGTVYSTRVRMRTGTQETRWYCKGVRRRITHRKLVDNEQGCTAEHVSSHNKRRELGNWERSLLSHDRALSPSSTGSEISVPFELRGICSLVTRW